MKKIAKKIGVIMVACVMASTVFTGCGTEKADSAEAAVKGLLEASKEVNFDKMANYTTDDTWDDQVEEMVTVDAWKNFMDITAPKMTYEITNVSDNGDQTTVTVDIKYFDGTEVYTVAMNEFVTEAFAMLSENKDMTEEETMDLLNDILEEKSKDMEETFSEKTIDFVCENNNDYKINNMDAEFAAVLTANLTAIADSLGEGAISE